MDWPRPIGVAIIDEHDGFPAMESSFVGGVGESPNVDADVNVDPAPDGSACVSFDVVEIVFRRGNDEDLFLNLGLSPFGRGKGGGVCSTNGLLVFCCCRVNVCCPTTLVPGVEDEGCEREEREESSFAQTGV